MSNAISQLTALSPLDGRYFKQLTELRQFFCEQGLIQRRVSVEIHWIIALAAHPDIKEIPNLSATAIQYLNEIIAKFNINDGQRVKELEAITRHDVKAVEYFLKEKIANHDELMALAEFIHFACTSEDINNLAYALILKDARQQALMPIIEQVSAQIKSMAHSYADQAMLARTHGQPASPTTVGKELANFSYRLTRACVQLAELPLLGKINGAVGNYNAHLAAYPQVDWQQFAQHFVNNLGLAWNPYTTQIEPHDYIAEFCHALARINTILLDFARDIWGYIALDYFRSRTEPGEVGSSTMPHKINPIDFENAEGNLGIANALLIHLAEKLPISRWQRDLSDSTVLRNLGVALGHSVLAYKSTLIGLNKLELNLIKLNCDLNEHWEVLAEAIQTVMRRYQLAQPYERLKAITRGQAVNRELLITFIDTLTELPDQERLRLKALTPNSYIGNAHEQAKNI